MKASEQGMAGRLARFEANINKGIPKRLALNMACNEPGDLPKEGLVEGLGRRIVEKVEDVVGEPPLSRRMWVRTARKQQMRKVTEGAVEGAAKNKEKK